MKNLDVKKLTRDYDNGVRTQYKIYSLQEILDATIPWYFGYYKYIFYQGYSRKLKKRIHTPASIKIFNKWNHQNDLKNRKQINLNKNNETKKILSKNNH